MKEWWIHLSAREKQTLSFGGIVGFILLSYFLLWSPLENKVTRLREQIQKDQQLLIWMKAADKNIKAIQKNAVSSFPKPSASLLSSVQNQINQSPIAGQLTQLRQAENDQVQLSFKQVHFDKLIVWLSDAWKEQGLIVAHITITPGSTPGMVSAELTLESS